MGDATPDGMQRLLNVAQWDAHAVCDDLRTSVVEHLGDRRAVLIINETGFLMQGTTSVGVQAQSQRHGWGAASAPYALAHALLCAWTTCGSPQAVLTSGLWRSYNPCVPASIVGRHT